MLDKKTKRDLETDGRKESAMVAMRRGERETS